MALVHFERKDFSVHRAATVLWRAVQATDVWDEPLTATRCVTLSGLPDHQIESAMIYLAGAVNADLDRADGSLTVVFRESQRPSWTLRLPSIVSTPASKLNALYREHRSTIVGGALIYPIGIIALLYGALLFSHVSNGHHVVAQPRDYLFGFGGAVGFTVGSVITIPFVILFFAIVTPLTGVVSIIEFLTHGKWLVAFFMAIGTALYMVFYVSLLPYVFAFHRLSYRVLSFFFSGFANWGADRTGPMEDETEFLEFLAAKSGRITRWDLMVHYGWTEQRAFEELTRLMVDYGGDVDVDEDGRITFLFPAYFDEPGRPVEPRRPRPPKEVIGESKRSEIGAWIVWALFSIPLLPFFLEHSVDPTVMVIGLWPAFFLVRRFVVARRARAFRALERRFEWLDRVSHSVQVTPDEVDEVTFAELGLSLDPEASVVVHDDLERVKAGNG